MTEMVGASTGIGGILSAMVYQIEQDNILEGKNAATENNNGRQSVADDQSTVHGASISGLPSALQSM